jgi:hypothetical protein
VATAVLDDLALAERVARAGDDQRLRRLAPLRVGDADHRHLEDAGMTADDLLDLARVDVGAPADDHVLLAIGDEQIAILVEVADVAGVQPAAAQGLGRRLRLVPVALHHDVAAYHDLAELAGRARLVLVVDDAHAHRRRLAPGRGEPAAGHRIGEHVLGLRQYRHRHRRLALAEDLSEHRPERAERGFQMLHVHRRAAVDDRVQAPVIVAPPLRRVQQRVDHRRHQEHRRDPVPGDGVEDARGIE